MKILGYQPRELAIRSGFALIGVTIQGFGAATLRVAGVGVDPYSASNIGVGKLLGMSLGIYQLIINAVILIAMLIWGRKYIGTGSVFNMVCVGFFIDLFTAMYHDQFHLTSVSLPVEIVMLIIGTLIFTFGASFYMAAKVGTSPYDGISPMIVDHTGWHYRPVRLIQDISFLGLALLVGGPVGIGTIVTAFCCGPFIVFWDEKIGSPLIEHYSRPKVTEVE
ncbi:YczE/YyaS/YitT family protein [Lapidilactobacillus gannanensis]|uniref:YitT family protein n=1 Tax=Lapidilactobacillus gannanensis TaxID=2486002 RepID=A0ABW4BJF1_9LACO|nr:hypothetical protein [Lapidilactobacillus gannanensis]